MDFNGIILENKANWGFYHCDPTTVFSESLFLNKIKSGKILKHWKSQTLTIAFVFISNVEGNSGTNVKTLPLKGYNLN